MMDNALEIHLKNNERLKKLSYLLYAVIASFMLSMLLVAMGDQFANTLATISAIVCVPIGFIYTKARRAEIAKFEGNV